MSDTCLTCGLVIAPLNQAWSYSGPVCQCTVAPRVQRPASLERRIAPDGEPEGLWGPGTQFGPQASKEFEYLGKQSESFQMSDKINAIPQEDAEPNWRDKLPLTNASFKDSLTFHKDYGEMATEEIIKSDINTQALLDSLRKAQERLVEFQVKNNELLAEKKGLLAILYDIKTIQGFGNFVGRPTTRYFTLEDARDLASEALNKYGDEK